MQSSRQVASVLGDRRFIDAAITRTGTRVDKTQLHEFRNLSADGGVIAAGALGKIAYANRAEALDADQQGKKYAVERPVSRIVGVACEISAGSASIPYLSSFQFRH